MKNIIINKNSKLQFFRILFGTLIAVGLLFQSVTYSQSTVDLGSAESFAVLAAAGITNTGETHLTGDIGSYPTTAITGFPPGTFSGVNHSGDEITQAAMVSLNTAYLDAESRTGADVIASELGGAILSPGVYKSAAGTFGITGTLTLDGEGVYIFQMLSTLTTAANSHVELINGAVWTNIFWQVGSSATVGGSIGPDSHLEGNILAHTSISVGSGANVKGRLLAGAVALSGAVTLDNNTALPVELTSFTATMNNGDVNLKWNTATEVNNFGFDIQRNQLFNLINGTWEKIGFVAGSGNSNSPKSYFYNDNTVSEAVYFYRLKQIDTDGLFEYSPIVEINTNQIPTEFSLKQNYPNPFNPKTHISFDIPVKSHATIRVFNVLGNEVAVLLNEEILPGKYSVEFNASNLVSGIYFYTISSNEFKPITKKMILLK